MASDPWARRYRIEGVPVVRVFPGLPASKAGMSGAWKNYRGEIVLGDIIVRIDDSPITNNDDYLSFMEHKKPGEEILVFTVLNDKERQYRLRLAEPQ